MSFPKKNKSFFSAFWVPIILILAPLYLYSCVGNADYDIPVEVDLNACDIVITADQLNNWIQNGYSDKYGFNKIVILDFSSTATYSAGHIPGALFATPVPGDTRDDGVLAMDTMIPKRGTVNAWLQSMGIDKNTVIVLTVEGNAWRNMWMGRLYYVLRYWGFPRCQIKLLDQGNDGWTTAGYALDSLAVSSPTASNFDVCDLNQNFSARATLQEMLNAASESPDNPNTVILDVRSAAEYTGTNGTGTTCANEGVSGRVRFDGHMQTAVNQEFSSILVANQLPDRAALEATMTGVGLSSTTTAYMYCRTSVRAGTNFLAIDGILKWPAKVYDGAWVQWGNLAASHTTPASNLLPLSSPWATDIAAYSTPIVYRGGVCGITASNPTLFPDPRQDLIYQVDSDACASAGGDDDGDGGGGGGGS